MREALHVLLGVALSLIGGASVLFLTGGEDYYVASALGTLSFMTGSMLALSILIDEDSLPGYFDWARALFIMLNIGFVQASLHAMEPTLVSAVAMIVSSTLIAWMSVDKQRGQHIFMTYVPLFAGGTLFGATGHWGALVVFPLLVYVGMFTYTNLMGYRKKPYVLHFQIVIISVATIIASHILQ